MKIFTHHLCGALIILTAFLFSFVAKGQEVDKFNQAIILNPETSSIDINLLEIEGLFTRIWLYHEIASNDAMQYKKIDGQALLKVQWKSGTYSIESLESTCIKLLEKSRSLDAQYDKQTKGSLISSCKDLHGTELMDFVMGINTTLTVNDSCFKSAPFCTGTIYSFPAGVNSGDGEDGPDYGCLGSTPNPVWYHMKIEQAGDITIKMVGKTQNNQSLDIDFALWGPYSNPITPCTAQLTANCNNCPNNTSNPTFYPSGNLHDCSYDSRSVENCHIVDGEVGEYYILIITNYDNQRGSITFEKISGDGTTDCSILPPPAASNSPICITETIEFTAADSPGAAYSWTGPNGFTSTQQNPTIPNAHYTHSGTYSLTITAYGITSDPTEIEVLVIDPPTATLTSNSPTTICEGDSIQLVVTTTSVGPFRVALGSGTLLPYVINFPEQVHTFWMHPVDTTTYYLVSVSNEGCGGQVSGSVTVNVKPKPDPFFVIENPCASLATHFNDATTVTGGSVNSWDWDFGDGTPHSNIQSPSHTYSSPGNYNIVLTVVANNGCSEISSVPAVIKATPNVSAGADISIPYGTNTQLNGTVTGGSGVHTYLWTPSDKVVDPTILNPNTNPLGSTVDFTLTATDQNGCINTDNMEVKITGGPLSAIVQANPSAICIGESSTINAVPSGGSGNYTFTWTSDPPGFNSPIEDPTVSPDVTTTYYLSINDNFNIVNIQITIVVYQKPIVNAGVDQTIAHGTRTTLSADVSGGTPDYLYSWNPASLVVTADAESTLTKNLYGSTNFKLHIEDAHECVQEDEMTVFIEGGPLQVNPIVLKPVICRNETTQLKALPSGGSNNYQSYSWSSVPSGFSSPLAEPFITPDVTTLYTVVVDDGYNDTIGSVLVTVNQLPEINLIPVDPRVTRLSDTEIGICAFDSIPITAGNPGAEYLWSNGSQEQTVIMGTSGITYDQQTYNVTVTDPLTECSNTATITAYFKFEYCSYGLKENEIDNRLKLYPNPSASGVFNMVIDQFSGNTEIEVFSSSGMKIFQANYKLTMNNSFKDEINLSNADKGVYFLKLKNPETTIVRKLIIN